ncbi:MAG TPA: MBOAT family O-acyltransferase [Planctomycetota bacterium]|nr:MBOAT family O-acyltransferase [Planctomycetota bacterium]
MVFSSPVFLFVFLPVVLALHFLLGRRFRNFMLTVASLLFYAWGEPAMVLVMIFSIVANYGFGLWLDHSRARATAGMSTRRVMVLALVFNLGMLSFFKYTNWLWDNLSVLLVELGRAPLPAIPEVKLPLGISFFTFHAISYLVDVYRAEVRAQRSLPDFGLYISMFSQLIAGPIVRYHHVSDQLTQRVVTTKGFAYGIRRFTVGLAKKLLIANTLAVPSDAIFAIPGDQLPAAVAWFGIVCYTVHIYFDFSGYSDMAIGLGHMLGFRFLENFNYPYISRTITEYWRRWHISLSTFLRDYLYFPLGGNRRGTARTYFNLFTVFVLCGLWHGAAWNFVLFGVLHGSIMVVERVGLSRVIDALPSVFGHAYFLLMLMISYVLFRAPDMATAGSFLQSMFGFHPDAGPANHVSLFVDNGVVVAMIAGVIGCTPWLPKVVEWRRTLDASSERVVLRRAVDFAGVALVLGLLAFSAMELSADTYNPFIYFRF